MRRRAMVCAAVLGLLTAMTGCGAVGGQAVPAASGTAVPGGTTGADLLKQHHWLDDSGKVRFGESAPKDPAVQQALCDFLFGSPDQVGMTARLTGTVKLAEGSGYQVRGGGGTGFRCAYDADGTTEFGLSIWTEPTEDTKDSAHLVTVDLPTGLYASSRYITGRDGAVVPDERARQWLTAAGDRVAAG